MLCEANIFSKLKIKHPTYQTAGNKISIEILTFAYYLFRKKEGYKDFILFIYFLCSVHLDCSEKILTRFIPYIAKA